MIQHLCMYFLVIRTYFILNVEQRICVHNYWIHKKITKKVKQHLVTFRSKSSSDKRKTTTYTWKSNYHAAIFQKRMGEYTVLAKLSLCKVAKLLIEFTLQQGCFTLFYLQMCCISLRRYYFELESRVIIKYKTHPFYPISFD